MEKRKILYLFDACDWDSRIAVAYGAKDKGFDVVIGLINGDDKSQNKSSDFKVNPIKKKGGNINPFGAIGLVRDINRMIKQENPDIIHTVTLKYSFLSAFAAFPYKNKHKIHTLAGLGYLFRSEEAKSKALRTVIAPHLKAAFQRANTNIIFQNQDDLDLLVGKNIATPESSILIKGSGVYLDKFNKFSDSRDSDKPIILMPTRLVHEKGVGIFIEAAHILKQRGIDAKFQIAGGLTDNPKAISKDEMIELTKDGIVEWLGKVDDIPERLSKASLIVYPSYYGEGIPRVLLEACAAGRAIVTTDNAGCREAVDHNENGLLVPIKDPIATADAIETIITNPKLRQSMERRSHQKAEQEFDINTIVDQTVNIYMDNIH